MQNNKEIGNVSATTAIELKAELAQHIDQFEKTRSSSGKQVTAKRPDKKPTIWSKQNQGVQERNQRDKVQQISQDETDVLKRSRDQLEKKAKYYEAMQSGKYKFNTDQDDDDAPLIDFDRKYFQEKELKEKVEEADRKYKKRKTDEEDDPWVEHEDEFGRTRIVRQSEVRKLQQSDEEDDDYFDENKDYTDYRPTEESIAAADRTDMLHYEADREIRTKGVGFYRFSKDEEERQEQLEKLNKIRKETENARKSVISSASKRKQMLAQNAEKIRARKAALQAKKHHQLKPEQVPKDVNIPSVVTEESVTDFLKSVRKQVE